jgi:hypothetical protein
MNLSTSGVELIYIVSRFYIPQYFRMQSVKYKCAVMYSSVLRLRNICILVMVYELEHFRSRGDIHCFQVLHSTIFQNAISATFCIVHLTNLMMFCVFIRISSLYCKFPDAWLIQMTLMF